MKKFKRFVIGGIENKIFNLVAISCIMIVLVYTVVLAFQAKQLSSLVNETNEVQLQSINEISSQTMKSAVEASMSQTNALEVYIADDLFGDVSSQVLLLSDYATKLYADPDIYPRLSVETPDKLPNGTDCTQLIFDDKADPDSEAIIDEIGLLANMSDMMVSLYQKTVLDSCFISTSSGITLFTDDRSSSKILDDGSVIKFNATKRPWFDAAVAKGGVYFTDVDTDTFTGLIEVVCVAPVYDKTGKAVAVVGADLFLDSMEMAVQSSDENGGFVFIINKEGQVIFSPKDEGILKVKTSDAAIDLRLSKNESLSSFISDALTGATDIREVEADGHVYYMHGAPLENVGWAIVSAVDKELTEQPTIMMQESYMQTLQDAREKYYNNLSYAKTTIISLLLLVLVLAVANAFVLSKRIVRPLNKMSEKVGEIQGENLDFSKDKIYETGDEIELLADAFLGLTNRTKSYINEITRITAEKERIGAELNVATKIQADMLPRIFPPFPERKEFELYATMTPAREVGGDFYDFFLVDDDHLALVMADVSGKGVPAALFMVIAKTLIKNHTMMGLSPAEVLKNVNEQLCEGNEMEYFVTVWLAVIEISTGKGMAANAGHEHPMLKRSGGSYEAVEYKHSPAVATMEGLKFREHEFELNKGDVLFVYTDGVPEATNLDGELFGMERLLTVLNASSDDGCETVLNAVREGIEDFVEGEEQFDDITMLALRYEG